MVNKIVSLLLAGVVFTSSSIQLSDAKNGGNIAERNKYSEDKEYWRIAELEAGLQSEDGEITEDLYNPLALTVSKGILDSETEWDSTITKSEGVELVVEVARQCTSIKTYGCRMGTIEGSDGLVDTDTVENTVEANAGAGYIPDGPNKDFAMQEEAAAQAEMEANGEVATPVGEFIEESASTAASLYSVKPSTTDKTTETTDKNKTTVTSTKTKTPTKKVVVTKIASKKMYVKKKVSTYKEPSSTAKKVKTLNKGKSVVVIGKATDSKGRAWYQIKTTSGKQFIIASALSKTKPKTTSAATTGSNISNKNNSTSNQNNNSSNSSTSKNNTSKNKSNYKEDSRYKKLPASWKKRVDKVMNKFPNLTYQGLADVTSLVGLDTVEEWANDGLSWDRIVELAEFAVGEHEMGS